MHSPASSTSANQSRAAQRLGPIWLSTGITRRNVLTYLYASFFTIGIVSFMSFMQPYVLAENLNIPLDQQGGGEHQQDRRIDPGKERRVRRVRQGPQGQACGQ
jgi:hypothetical protein